MKKNFLFLFSIIFSLVSFAQNENANWCMIQNAKVGFLPTVTTSTCASSYIYPNPYGGAGASVSDKNGQLLFYTNGIKVWDRNNNLMPNGTNLNGLVDALYNQQTTIIVPKPQKNGVYYIFTVNCVNNAIPSGHAGLNYSVVDMSLNSGLGDVTAVKNIPLKDETGTLMDYNYSTGVGLRIRGQRLTSTYNAAKDKIWITFFTRFNIGSTIKRAAYSYLISNAGINNTADGGNPAPTNYTILNNSLYSGTGSFDGNGNIKVSPNGSYLCDAQGYNIQLYSFNNQTGAVSFLNTVYTGAGPAHPAGTEFSPNSQFLYFGDYDNTLYQQRNSSPDAAGGSYYIVRVQQYNIARQATTLVGKYDVPVEGQVDNAVPVGSAPIHGDLQLAIDNKIYMCSNATGFPPRTRLGIIQNPDVAGTGCNFIANGLLLAAGTTHDGNLPQWVHKTLWPKVYNGKGNMNLLKDNSGNVYMSVHELCLVDNPVNHYGFTPPPLAPITNNYEQYTVNYVPNTTNTTWGRALLAPSFALNNGTIQFSDNTYCNATTGVTVTGPSLVPANEKILAEIGNPTTTYITKKDYQLWVHNSTINISFPVAWNVRSKFNSATNKLYIWEVNTPSTGLSQLKIYTFTGTTLTGPTTYSFAAGYDFVHVNNNDNIFINVSGVLKQFTPPSTFTTMSIPGFTNSTISRIDNNNPYTEMRCMVLNQTEKNLYMLDLSPIPGEKKIHQGNSGQVFSYLFNGTNDVYLAGYNMTQDFPVGPQSIAWLSTHQNCFLTKLNLSTDFTLRPAATPSIQMEENNSSFNVMLMPNPVTGSTFRVAINEKNRSNNSSYTISVVNQSGRIVLKRNNYVTGTILSLEGMEKGVYHVEVINNEGEKVSTSLVNL